MMQYDAGSVAIRPAVTTFETVSPELSIFIKMTDTLHLLVVKFFNCVAALRSLKNSVCYIEVIRKKKQ